MNTRRLAVDFMRRSRQPLAVLLFAYFWWMVELRPTSTRLIMAGSMWLTFFIGPAAVFSMLTPDAVRLLPLSRREIWLARWWLSIVTPVMIAAAGKLIGIGLAMTISGDAAPDWPAWWLSNTYDLAYAGLFLGLVPWMNGWRRFIAVVAFVGGMFWPIVLVGRLPLAWSALIQSPVGVAVAAALVMGIASYRFSPQPTPYTSTREVATARRPDPARPSRWAFGDSFSGLTKLVWTDWALTVRNLVLLLVGYVVTIGGFMMIEEKPSSLVALLREISLLPFDRDTAPGSGLTAIFLLGLFGVGAKYSSTMPNEFFHAMARALRALPIGPARLVTLLLVTPLLGWATLWALLIVVQIAVTGRLPVTLHWELFALLPAIDVLGRALQLQWRRDALAWHLLLIVIVLVALGSARSAGMSPLNELIGSAFVAAALYGAAILLNYLALTRSRSPYARPLKGAAGL